MSENYIQGWKNQFAECLAANPLQAYTLVEETLLDFGGPLFEAAKEAAIQIARQCIGLDNTLALKAAVLISQADLYRHLPSTEYGPQREGLETVLKICKNLKASEPSVALESAVMVVAQSRRLHHDLVDNGVEQIIKLAHKVGESSPEEAVLALGLAVENTLPNSENRETAVAGILSHIDALAVTDLVSALNAIVRAAGHAEPDSDMEQKAIEKWLLYFDKLVQNDGSAADSHLLSAYSGNTNDKLYFIINSKMDEAAARPTSFFWKTPEDATHGL